MSAIWEPMIRKKGVQLIPKNNIIINHTSDSGHVKHNCGVMRISVYGPVNENTINTGKKILPDGSIPWIQLFRNKL